MGELLMKQQKFATMIPGLIEKALSLGYEVTLGDAYRDPRTFGAVGVRAGYGHPRSAHKSRLAIDLNLFKDGRLCSSTEDHKLLGEWWESQGGSWGGRFNDGNHYSLEHGGMK